LSLAGKAAHNSISPHSRKSENGINQKKPHNPAIPVLFVCREEEWI
jgi:hypothetical protein